MSRRRHWRSLYLERRAQHLQSTLEAALKPAETSIDAGAVEDEARRAWRQSYLERRIASLREHAAQQEAPAPQADIAPQLLVAAVETSPAEAPAPIVEMPAVVDEETIPAPAPLTRLEMSDRPPSLPAARNGAPDDFTLIEGVSPMLQSTLHSLGFYHFDQIAAWSPAHIAWVDQYLRLRGRIVDEEWIEQAQDLAQGHGVARAERVAEDA